MVLSVTGHYKAQAAAAAELVRQFTVPLFKQRTPSTPEFEGTGLLLEVDADHRFMVTAAHVLDHLQDGVFLLSEGREEYALSGRHTVTALPPSGDREADTIDLGYIRLTAEEVLALGPENFLPLRWLGVRDALIEKRGSYFILGYPAGFQQQDFSKRMYQMNPIYYWGPEAKRMMYKYAKLTREAHLLLRYHPNRIVGPNGIGGSPSFRGMSGCGIWRFSPFEIYRPDNLPRLVAIHLGRGQNVKELVGSRISLLIESLRAHYPYLDRKLPHNPGLIVNLSMGRKSDQRTISWPDHPSRYHSQMQKTTTALISGLESVLVTV